MSDEKDITYEGTFEQKLKMVADEMLDPKEVGLTTPEEAKLAILKKEPPARKLGDFIQFEASEVPIGLRARWARSDMKIIPPNPALWEADWIKEHADEHLIQGKVRSGNALAGMEQLVTDPILGMINIMSQATELLLAEYEKEKNTITVETEIVNEQNPPKT